MTVSTAATVMPAPVLTPHAPAEGGLLLSELDPWGDAGLLHLPTTTTPIQAEPQGSSSFSSRPLLFAARRCTSAVLEGAPVIPSAPVT